MRRSRESVQRHSSHTEGGDPNQRDPLNMPDRRGASRFLPVLLFIAVAMIIASQEVPQVSDAIDSIIRPQQLAARKTCQAQALKQSSRPDFARIIRSGEAVKTNNGLLVRDIVMGEMDEQGQERRVPFHCYFDASGQLISSQRTQAP